MLVKEGKMIEYNILRDLALKAISIIDADSKSRSRRYPRLDLSNICKAIASLIIEGNLFPGEADCKNVGIEYNLLKSHNKIGDENRQVVKYILWDLIQENTLLINDVEDFNYKLTEIGKTIINKQKPPYYDPEGYIEFIILQIPKFDSVIKEYVKEGLSCYRQRLFFATAVMFGAAAERTLLLLLESIEKAETDQAKKKKIRNLLDYPRISQIISLIESRLEQLMNGRKKKSIPYKVHEGCMRHIVSFYEMIRIQRNDSTHPAVGKVNRHKVFLTIQSFPVSLEIIYRLIKWFKRNKI